ncbi:MAG: uroporphyrinogen-III C-methyltransferase [Acidobacteria bacterium]|nr:uroporphyrinogen-III C-methyltransferase [Acidobacteriota bacterium]MDW7983638.1 uroporphyrinogen-III C-methyltransferase [Acidobacteriota bacterium]
MKKGGVVYIVGAGPGDPGLLTLRACRILRQADVVFYDRLVSPGILRRVAPGARRICVEKKKGSVDLSDLVRRMVREAQAGRVVVRLKGGDPFVFGRGAEEAGALVQAGVACEVIPGVTSAIAVPAAAGIPVTHRGMARGFVVETAHRAGEEAPILATIPPEAGLTRVFLMVVATLETVVGQLLAQGYDPATPAAVIEWGTTPAQRVWVASLEQITAVARASGVEAPAVLVVGPVVQLQGQLRVRPGHRWVRA